MTEKKSTLLDQTYTSFIDLMLSSDVQVDHLGRLATNDVMGFGTTVDEKIHDLKGLINLAKLQREQSAGAKFHYTINPVFRKTMNQDSTAIIVDEIQIIMQAKEEKIELQVRLSTVLDFIDGNWKVVHWHGSKPEYDSGGSDTWHKEEWKQRNDELQKLVEEKTSDLENKNRELELEASLERVRAVAMSMQKPDDILDVCKIISDQLENLDISDIRNTQVAIIDESKKNYLNYQYFSPYSKKVFEETEYENNPESQAMVEEMQKSANSFYAGSIKGKALQEFITWRKKYNQYPDPVMDKSSAVHYYFYSIGNGGLGLTTYKAINNKELKIFKRFHKVFELAYRRFHDIENAEAQAREAQIEAALERVRARSMAMHKSEELAALSLELVKQVQALGVATWFCAFNIYDEDQKGSLEWGSNGQGTFPKYRTPREGIFLRYYEVGQSGETLLINEIDENECPGHYDYLCSLPGVGEQLLKMKGDGISFPTSQIDHVAYFKYGYILFITFEPATEAHDIFKRFAKIFEQTYTRFLDLQKAEKQAREAQIETALERVRSRTMAMQNSNELPETSLLLFQQFKELGEKAQQISIAIVDDDKKEIKVSATLQGSKLEETFNTKFDEKQSVVKKIYKAWKSNKKSVRLEIKGKELTEYNRWRNKLGKTTFYSTNENAPSRWIINIAPFSNGMLSFSNHEPASADTIQLLVRFAAVFDGTYTRFLDLKKAEEQAREAQIELSLERIRAQVTAMSESSDLLDIVVTMRTEFVSLGHEAHYFWYMRYHPETYEKAMTSGDGTKIGMIMTLPRHIHGDIKLIDDWEKSDEPTIVFAMDVETAVEYIHKMITLGDFIQVDPNAPTLDDIRHINGLTFIMARTTHGEIGFSLPGNVPDPPQESLDTLTRFSGVFDLAYRRFEDLQSAEQQNRETQIELALERVRAKTMAMHQTSELQDVINVVHQQFSNLNMDITGGAFIAINEEINKEISCWGAGGTANYIQRVHIPYLNRPIYTDLIKGIKKGPGFYSEEYTHDEKIEFFEHLFKHPPYNKAPTARKKEVLGREGGYARSCYVSKYTTIFIINHHGRNFANADIEILKRIGKVFEQSYTRFMDLKKAEEQAREAQIEAALERVRSKTMAMHNSEDMGNTVLTLFHEVLKLGLDDDIRCGIGILEESERMETRSATLDSNGEVDLKIGMLDMTIHPMLKRIKKAWKSGGTHFTDQMTGEDVIKYYTALNNEPDYPFYVDLDTLPETQFHNSFSFTEGILFAFSPNLMSDEATKVLDRFARVFGQTYRRFRDLQKAEAQTREARIEASLERIRSQAMAMQHSDDLVKSTAILFEEFEKLELSVDRCGIGIFDAETRDCQLYTTVTTHDGKTELATGITSLTVHPMLIETFEAWESQQSLQYILEGKELEDYYALISKSEFHLPSEAIENSASLPKEYYLYTPFGAGGLYVFSATEPAKEEKNIIRRFAEVFHLTYTRYEDLQKAEARALEAVKQASLDRVRGEIASMRTPEDLQRITPLIWSELKILKVPFIRCGAFMIDESNSVVQAHLTTPDGKPIGALNLPFDANDLTYNTVEHWRKKKVYTHHWDKEDFINWMKSMVSLGQIQTPAQYQGSEKPPETLDLHFIPFKQGMLYVGNTEPLLPEKIDSVKTLAKAFSIAYARYEDFVNLEDAKIRVEKTLSELKSTQSQLIHAEKMASLGELTAGIAHEIQNPLNFVNNFSEVNTELIEELIEELEKGDLIEVKLIADDIAINEEKIKHHGKRADGIVKGMLQHSRTTPDQKEATDINALADEYLRLAYHGLRAKDKSFNADFKTELDMSLPKINAIPQDIGRVLLNLINNAFHACTERNRSTESSSENNYKPLVIVSTKKLEDKVKITVKDNGSGIPDSIKEKIFQPFFTTKATGEGTGLGLSLSYDIVTKGHGGTMHVETKEGEGTKFIIQLPVN